MGEQRSISQEKAIQSQNEKVVDSEKIKSNVEESRKEGEILETVDTGEKSRDKHEKDKEVMAVVEGKSNTKAEVEVEKSNWKDESLNEWERVSGEKVGRSSKSPNLKYGQVTISTLSRFAVLSQSKENDNEEEMDMVVSEVEDMRS